MPPIPPSPTPPSFRPGALFKLRPAGRRWPLAARAALCMGVPVLVGWGAGDIAAGLMATIGAFTALYGSDRPYLNRAAHLGAIAVSFALAVMLGVSTAESPLLVVPAVVFIAVVATFLCNALRVGPPGAYMFALACAAGTGMPIGHLSVMEVGLLVLAGGSFAWLVHIAGALVWPRGPERTAVAMAAQAVARFIETVGTPDEDSARHAAAMAMHDAWTALVTHQPVRPRPSGSLNHLRMLNRDLNLLLARVMNAPNADEHALAAAVHEARMIGVRARKGGEGERTDPEQIPLGYHGLLEALRENLHLYSPALLAAARVGVAAAIAGAISAALDLERAYWTMAAAVLMLHQGLDWSRSLRRGIERISGTIVGLILAGIILAVHPEGLWLVAILMALQFTIEMTVTRNYALAVVFITAAALTIASGGHAVPDVGHILWVRGTDTFLGCMIGLIILALTTPRSVAVRIPQELANLLARLKPVLEHAATGDVTTGSARRARRDLQQSTIAVLQAYDISSGATLWHRDLAERSWPAVVAAQRLSYRVLATCWSLENAGPDASEMARTLFGPDGRGEIHRALAVLSEAIRAGTRPAPLSTLPEFLNTEMRNLRDSLVDVRDLGSGSDASSDGPRLADPPAKHSPENRASGEVAGPRSQ